VAAEAILYSPPTYAQTLYRRSLAYLFVEIRDNFNTLFPSMDSRYMDRKCTNTVAGLGNYEAASLRVFPTTADLIGAHLVIQPNHGRLPHYGNTAQTAQSRLHTELSIPLSTIS
jgi:hypothetical protein